MKYRKRPVVIEAIQLDGTEKGFLDVIRFMEIDRDIANVTPSEFRTVTIHTLEGDMVASVDDWIIKEPFSNENRQFYPCKPDIFEATYELVEDTELLI